MDHYVKLLYYVTVSFVTDKLATIATIQLMYVCVCVCVSVWVGVHECVRVCV